MPEPFIFLGEAKISVEAIVRKKKLRKRAPLPADMAAIKDRKWYLKQSDEKLIWVRAQKRAHKNKLEFTLTVEDIVIPKFCPILGIPIKKICRVDDVGKYAARGSSPSLDRLDTSKGYVKGNVEVISHKANAMKSNATPEQLLNYAKWINERFGDTCS